METDEIARQLARLDAATGPAAERFDTGPAFAGRVAVLPSAFNPPTVAHFALLDAACADGGTRAAMLSTKNVAKTVHGASLSERVEMLLAAGEDVAVLAVNAARLADQGVALRAAFPGVAFDFVVGYDTLVRLFDRQYYGSMEEELAEFFAHHRVIAANRGDDTIEALLALLCEDPARQFADRVVAVEVHEGHATVSSSAAREAAGRGEHHETVPAGVAAYIRAHGLYR
ncbi:MAG: hypothetical protein HY875_01080 [Chloroflexi bacterium]|nr:hypothetical protein [Chloroflexota bacterium]